MCYTEHLHERVRQMTGSLGRREGDPDHDLQEGPDVELELKRWLDGRAPQRILAWFDARQVAGIPHDVTNMRWSASAVERDALFLGLLGIAEGNG